MRVRLPLALAAAAWAGLAAAEEAHQSLTRAVAATPEYQEPEWSEPALRGAYDGEAPPPVTVAGEPGKRRQRLEKPGGKAGASAQPLPRPVRKTAPRGFGVSDAVREAVRPFKTAIEGAWTGAWSGWTKLSARLR